MKAEIKYFNSPDVDNLELYKPEKPDNFCLLLQVMAGPEGVDGEESFDITVCTPKWIMDNSKGEIIIGRHYLITPEYNWREIHKLIDGYVKKCGGSNWRECAEKLSRLGHWEFEDYRE